MSTKTFLSLVLLSLMIKVLSLTKTNVFLHILAVCVNVVIGF